jgi:RNA polymerase sigma-70 factor (ECF subfamily)
MSPDGLTGRIDDQDPDRRAEGDDPSGITSEHDRHTELDIEKKWLQWTRVDPEQFHLFYDKYHDVIMGYFFKRVGDFELAGELAGEVFAQAWEKLPGFRWQGYSFSAWLFHIARQVMGRHWRRIRKISEEQFSAERAVLMQPVQPDEEFQKKRDERLVRLSIQELVPDRQEVIILHYWMGMTVKDIAVVMKLGQPLVKAHLRRGRRQMRRWLLDHGLEFGMSNDSMRNIRDEEARDSGWGMVGGDDE